MSYVFGNESQEELEGLHPDLVKVMTTALFNSEQDFSAIEGMRSVKRQRSLVRLGKSQTMNSRHLTGHAIDVVPYPVSWDWDKFYPIADAVIAASKHHNVAIRWGGNWRVKDLRLWEDSGEALAKAYPGDFPDGPHFELAREFYS
jgi:peptidoglycan L-alanyl-D-glutamate endopeptidase CwlK